MTTQQAFENLLSDPSSLAKLKVGIDTPYTWRNRLKAGKLTLDKMEEILKKAGYKKKPEAWSKK